VFSFDPFLGILLLLVLRASCIIGKLRKWYASFAFVERVTNAKMVFIDIMPG
jgi:hypothetical protein